MAAQFFPNIAFGWAFVAVLFVILAMATYMDLSLAIIPKWVSVTALPVGIVFNIFRCGWLASNGLATWHWKEAGIALGALDGFLFALEGFLFGFTFYTILWLLGVAGGGDVKLCAAIGAWVGPTLTLWVIIVSIVIVFALVLVHGVYALSRGSLRGLRKQTNMSAKKRARRLLTFSTPLCLATLLVLYGKLGQELKIAPEMPAGIAAGGV
jgi:Flp pilus assembly protein protease CpaA